MSSCIVVPKEKIRTITPQVSISYGQEETVYKVIYCDNNSGNHSVNHAAGESEFLNPISRPETLHNANHIPAVKPFTLEENTPLTDMRGLIDPKITGWWGTGFSAETENPVGDGYTFADPPCLDIGFGGDERSIKSWEIFGESERLAAAATNETPAIPYLDAEFPVEFTIEAFKVNDINPFFRRTYRNDRFDCVVSFMPDGNAPSYLTDIIPAFDNGYIKDVSSLKITLLKWNLPNKISKIYRCYDNIVENYGAEDLKSFECTHEIKGNGEIAFGLVSGACSVKLYNRERRFDIGYLADMACLNRQVIPFLSTGAGAPRKLGTYFIKEWNISQDDMFVECKGNDRLLGFQDLKFDGLAPQQDQSGGDIKIPLGGIFEIVLDAANNLYDKRFAYDVDGALYDNDFLVCPYLKRDTFWATLQRLCEASLSYVYVDSEDKILIKSLFGAAAPLSGITDGDAAAQISPSNAFSIKIPNFADMQAGNIEVPYFDIIKDGNEVSFEKQIYSDGGVKPDLGAYIHGDCELIQDSALAQKIAEMIKEVYKIGTKSATAQWRGKEKLKLFDICKLTDRFKGEGFYTVSSIKNIVKGGFKQEIKGILQQSEKPGTYEGGYKIKE